MISTKPISFMNLFFAIQVELAKRGIIEFEIGIMDPKWHKAYFEAKKQFPEAMEYFEVHEEKGKDPFVLVDGLVLGLHDSVRAGHLLDVSYLTSERYRTERVEGIEQYLLRFDNNSGEVAKYICNSIYGGK